MTISSIEQNTIIDNKRDTGDRINGEIFIMPALFPDDATLEGANNYCKDPLSAYKATADPDTKADERKEFLLAMIRKSLIISTMGNSY